MIVQCIILFSEMRVNPETLTITTDEVENPQWPDTEKKVKKRIMLLVSRQNPLQLVA